MFKYIVTLTLVFIVIGVKAQVYQSETSAQIYLSLKKLNVVGSVLYVAAHPDDENTRLLSYLANEKKLRTGYLSLTRGDGGQNLIGKEQGELLGLIRTQELLAARRVDGAEQFFTRANDFGYSKTPEETFTFWNNDSVLSDVVLAIRKFKPDVIICRFPTTGEGGHGHHTASAILALQAFDAAANPNQFPEQLKELSVWQAKRIFWNTFNFGTTNTTSPNQLKIDVGSFNPLLGKNYGEIASESRSMHKSQGFGSARQRGSIIEYFKLLKGDSVSTDAFENINTNWNRFKETEGLQQQIDACIKKFNIEKPELIVSDLISIHKNLSSIKTTNEHVNYWKDFKLKELEKLIQSCSGLWLEAHSTEYYSCPGNTISVSVQSICRNNSNVKLNSVSLFSAKDTVIQSALKQNEALSFKTNVTIPTTFSYSNPYWLNQKHDLGFYNVTDKQLIGTPQNNPVTKVLFSVTIEGLNLVIEKDLIYKYTDPVKGEVYRAFEILPPVTLNFSDKSYIFSELKSKKIQVIVKSNKPNLKGKLQLPAQDGWLINIKEPDFVISQKGEEKIIDVLITPTAKATTFTLNAQVIVDNKSYNHSIKRIEYDHIPYQFILSDAEAKCVYLDVKKTGLNIGYISGAGDDVPMSLSQIGYNVTTLSDELLVSENLQKYDAIVTGVRAYNTNERLQIHYSKLMDYVNNGGNLVVQYNTNNRIGPVSAKIGPYPFTISRDRVTDEKAKVLFKNEKHTLLNYPNKITESDFENWIQERGIYFVSEMDKNYETIFVMNDVGEKALEGSLIVTKYGKGNFVYTGLAFFRQLPAGVPGAYRLFSNILSIPKNK